MFSLESIIVASSLLGAATATFFPPQPIGMTLLKSKFNSDVTISYKETKICETTPGVKSYSGYIHLPPSIAESRPYPVNTFFWFFESRKDPANAPLAVWTQGGPGAPSIVAAIGENGPCYISENSKDTTLNQWSWNNEVNMIYIDQPVQVGFSYDSLVNGTINQLISPVDVFLTEPGPAAVNHTYLIGTFPSQNKAASANTTAQASVAMWHFLQTFTQEFPAYKPKDDKISFWTESYGGHYGPAFSEFFESQNDLIASGSLPNATPLHMDTLGIVNGCVDILTQMPYFPQFANHNPYGIEVLTENEFKAAVGSWPQCEKLIQDCRRTVAAEDPKDAGTSTAANTACAKAFDTCFKTMHSAYEKHEKDVFDVTQSDISSFPPQYAAGWLNSGPVQESLGVPLNFTGQTMPVFKSFMATGDFVRSGNLENIGKLLNRGVKVALMYGDRDYQCNWLGGEAMSLAVNSTISSEFKAAGYAKLNTNPSYVGGLTRQHGNFSFTRVFDAGHSVPWFQPETAYRIFYRAMFNTDIATGTTVLSNSISTTGPQKIFDVLNPPADEKPHFCYTWDVYHSCTKLQKQILAQGTGIIRDFILIGYIGRGGKEVLFDYSREKGYTYEVTGNGTACTSGCNTTTLEPSKNPPSLPPTKGGHNGGGCSTCVATSPPSGSNSTGGGNTYSPSSNPPNLGGGTGGGNSSVPFIQANSAAGLFASMPLLSMLLALALLF